MHKVRSISFVVGLLLPVFSLVAATPPVTASDGVHVEDVGTVANGWCPVITPWGLWWIPC